MPDELQGMVDRVAAELNSPAVLEDTQQRMIVYSLRQSVIDSVRRDSIMNRETAPDVAEWFESFGIHGAHDPLWIPGSRQHDILGRICCPIRHRGQLLGFLWLLDDDRMIFDTKLVQRPVSPEHLALALYEHKLVQGQCSELVSQVLSSTPDLQAAAVASISDRELWPRGAGPCAIVATLTGEQPGESEQRAGSIRQAITQRPRQTSPRCPASARPAAPAPRPGAGWGRS